MVTTSVKNSYDAKGIQTELKNNLTGKTLWKINKVNAKGLMTQMAFGNGYTITNTYNRYYMPEKIIHQNTAKKQTAINIDYRFDDKKGLLRRRNNHLFNKDE